MASLPNVLTVEHNCPKCGVATIELRGIKFEVSDPGGEDMALSVDATDCYVYCPICKLDGRDEL